MSHWFKLHTRLTDRESIIAAANNLGYTVKQNTECRGYRGNRTQCDMVLLLPGEYDLGFNFNPQTREYEIVADFWQDHISRYLGNKEKIRKLEQEGADENTLNTAKIGKFLQEYNLMVAENLLTLQGLLYTRHETEDGTIVLEVEGV